MFGDGTVHCITGGAVDLCEWMVERETVEALQEPAVFADCLTNPWLNDRFECLRQATTNTIEICVAGESNCDSPPAACGIVRAMSKLSLCVLLLVGCSTATKPETPPPGPTAPRAAPVATPPTAPEPPADSVATLPPAEPAPAEPAPAEPATGEPRSVDGDSCGDADCKAPHKCITVVGKQKGSARKECWIPCPDRKCPAGLECTMRYDGPGHVCIAPD